MILNSSLPLIPNPSGDGTLIPPSASYSTTAAFAQVAVMAQDVIFAATSSTAYFSNTSTSSTASISASYSSTASIATSSSYSLSASYASNSISGGWTGKINYSNVTLATSGGGITGINITPGIINVVNGIITGIA